MSEDRAALIERHLDLARRAARLYHPRVRHHVELDELIAMGQLGLAEAASRYDPSQGASFRTYAWYRVQGAIIDGMRRLSNLPRRVWAQLTVLRATADYLEAQAARSDAARAQAPAPTTADRLRAVKDALGAIRTMYVMSLELPDEIVGPAPRPDARIAAEQESARLHAALARLPDRERELLDKHYREGKNLLDAGAELGMSKSWASRLHARAIDRLRELLAEPE